MRVLADFPMADRREIDLPNELVGSGLVVFMRPYNQVPGGFSLVEGDPSRARQNKWYLRRTSEVQITLNAEGVKVLEVWRAE